MVKLRKNLLVGALFSLLAGLPCGAAAQTISEFTSFPPFLPRVASPNILFMLDYSDSMVRPAYGECNPLLSDCRTTFQQFDDFVPADTYYGYFDGRYNYSSGKYVKDAAGSWDGNWLNWLTMTQFDVLKKVSVGGHISPAPEQANPRNFDLASQLKAGPVFYRVVKADTCTGKVPAGDAAALCNAAVPQEISYRWVDTPTTGATYLWNNQLVTDENSKNITLPFTFRYYGDDADHDFTHANVSDNGFVQLVNDTTVTGSYYANKSLPYNDTVNNLIAIWWDDLSMRPKGATETDDKASYVAYFVQGEAGNQVLVITWQNIYPFNVTTLDKAVTFQMLLFEKDGHIVFQYKDVDGGASTYIGGDGVTNNTDKARSATIGVEDGTGTQAKQYSHNGSRLLRNQMALLATPGYTVFTLTPRSSNSNTLLQPAPPLNAAGTDREISIQVLKQDGCPAGSYTYSDDSPNHTACYDHNLRGLIQELRDSEKNGNLGFRLGIMQLNSADGGTVIKHFNDKETTGWPSLMNTTRSQTPTGSTPLAEALHIAQGYFRQDTAFNLGLPTGSSWSNTGTGAACGSNSRDPFCFASAGRKVECVKSYALLISSGNYSHDFGLNLNGTTTAGDLTPQAASWLETGGSNYLEKIAYKGHTTDLRDLNNDGIFANDGMQELHLYAVNTYGGEGEGTTALKRAAYYGGFKTGDSIDAPRPRTYYRPQSGSNLRDQIISAVNEILKNSASGTSVSVLSTSAGGEGALYQAYFYPAKVENDTDDRRWPGFLRAFFLDRQQQLRDDSGAADSPRSTPDARLIASGDKRVEMFLHNDSNEVLIRRRNEDDTIIAEGPYSAASPPAYGLRMDDATSIWEGGGSLAKMDNSKNGRNLYLWLDENGDGVVNQGDFGTLGAEARTLPAADPGVTDTAVTDLIPYLRAADTVVDGVTRRTAAEEAVRILNFVRGKHVEGFRNRCITVPGATAEDGCDAGQRVWPLGDIIFSTPTLVGVPGEKFDAIYGDPTYRAFTTAYKGRRQMVYVGANDGLLHAYNAGFYTSGDDPDSPSAETGWFQANADATDNDPKIGQEKWAFVPYDNLPHLAWLACSGTVFNANDPDNQDYDPAVCGSDEYTHVFYVDQRPKVTDVRIFCNDDTAITGCIDGQSGVSHPQGWGTILLMPMRLGGGAIEVTADFGSGSETRTFRSAIYAFDVTNPEEEPRLLWRFTDSALGFTTSYPGIVRVGPEDQPGSWFMVIGSGPENQAGSPKEENRDYNHLGTGTSGQPGKVFVVDLKTGLPPTGFTPFTAVAANAVMGDPTVVDVDLDFQSDVIYIGSAINTTSGRVFRINTNQNTDPSNWALSTLFDPVPGTASTTIDPDPTNGKDMGPLLVGPSVSKDISGNLWVFFGSGRLKSTADLTNFDRQRFYGIKDNCWKSTAETVCTADVTASPDDYAYKLSHLYDAGAVKVRLSETPSMATRVDADANTVCAVATAASRDCNYQDLLNFARGKKGWYVDLFKPPSNGPSERVLARSSVLGGLVLFTTYQPSGDICSIFGQSNLYALYYETGTAYFKPVRAGDEGKYTLNSVDYVQQKFDIGEGMPTSVGVAIGETVTGFVQKSTGEIFRIETQPGLGVRSGVSSWREKTNGGGTVEVETIYKHIVK